jgi:hypothetical protein
MLFNIEIYLRFGCDPDCINRTVFYLIPLEANSLEELSLVEIKKTAINMLQHAVNPIPLYFETYEINITIAW